MIGKTLGHYQISSQLGKGGMGEVYQAKDRKLGRDVAIKVLPEEFARDADRVARFQREAKLLASLNHTNIAAIYGLEESGGTSFLVLELVPGETLADRIKAGPIPVEESLKLALQIAEALEAAHEKGVIHRDLKPANIKVTPEGKVKVLDFGLAKAFAGEQGDLNPSNSPTLSDAATQQGVILGTAAYMSPEQAKGKIVDKRADIWAFGVVLFEMLTGRPLFSGETVSETLAAVLMREPDFSALPPNLHPRIRFLLERCLEKQAKDRYHDISDVRVDIQKVLADRSGVFAQPVTAVESRTRPRAIMPWAAATLVLGLIIAGVAVWNLRKPEPKQVMRFDYELPEGQQFTSLSLSVLTVSPDGKQLVYSTTNGLFIRSVNELTAKLLAGTDGPTSQPFFSPDGKWIGYFSVADRQLKKINAGGGAPVTLCPVPQLVGASWGKDNTIVYGQLPPGPIMRISGNGGTPEALIKQKSAALLFPQMLPDGNSVLYAESPSLTQSRIMVQSLESGESKELFAGTRAEYLSTGHLIYGLRNNNNLFAVPFDLDKLEVAGGPIPIVEGMRQCGVSEAGTLAYIPGTATGSAPGRTLVWVDRNGKEDPLPAPPNDYMQPKISPDGTRVAVTIEGADMDIGIWDLTRNSMTRLTFDERRETVPLWTPDGKRIIYARGGLLGNSICWKPADGTGKVEQLISLPDRELLPWSIPRDGKILIMSDVGAGDQWDIGILSLDGNHARKLLLAEKHAEGQPQISPDGQWIAYNSSELSGVMMKAEVYIRPFPDVDKGKWQVSTKGGNSSLWSRDGKELFYLSDDNSAMVVSVETKPTFRLGIPKFLFKNSNLGVGAGSGTPWDIHPDGKRFLMIKPPGAAPSTGTGERPKITIVLNWFEELKHRVPTK